jgi:hypothetical protein
LVKWQDWKFGGRRLHVTQCSLIGISLWQILCRNRIVWNADGDWQIVIKYISWTTTSLECLLRLSFHIFNNWICYLMQWNAPTQIYMVIKYMTIFQTFRLFI